MVVMQTYDVLITLSFNIVSILLYCMGIDNSFKSMQLLTAYSFHENDNDVKMEHLSMTTMTDE